MKIDLFSIGKFTIHGYGLMIAIGILCCVAMASYRAKKNGLDQEAIVDIGIYGVIGGFFGGKILYVIVEFKTFIKDPKTVLGSEGFVVYGGIIAGFLTAIVYCRIKKLYFLEYFDLAVASISMAQGFGRIGCFLAGCCYGRETTSRFGVVFPEGGLAPAGVKLIPTQLISSAGDFLIMICSFIFSIHIMIIDYFSPAVDGVKMSCIQFFVCGLLCAVPMLLFETPDITQLLAAWKPVLYAGIMSSGVAYTLQIVGQKGMNPTVASLILSLEAVVSVLAGFVILDQQLTMRETMGCAFMFCAIVLAQLPQKNIKNAEAVSA